MRKIPVFLPLFFFVALFGKAQTKPAYKAFCVNMGIGAVIDASDPNGFLFSFEPGYTFHGKYKLGLNLEMAHRSMKNVGATVITFDHYPFALNRFRPFLGLGLGSYQVDAAGGCDPGPGSVNIVRTTDKFGGKLRTGFELGFFHFAIEYSFLHPTFVSALDVNGKPAGTVSYQNSYGGIKFGFTIGGGRKKMK